MGIINGYNFLFNSLGDGPAAIGEWQYRDPIHLTKPKTEKWSIWHGEDGGLRYGKTVCPTPPLNQKGTQIPYHTSGFYDNASLAFDILGFPIFAVQKNETEFNIVNYVGGLPVLNTYSGNYPILSNNFLVNPQSEKSSVVCFFSNNKLDDGKNLYFRFIGDQTESVYIAYSSDSPLKNIKKLQLTEAIDNIQNLYYLNKKDEQIKLVFGVYLEFPKFIQQNRDNSNASINFENGEYYSVSSILSETEYNSLSTIDFYNCVYKEVSYPISNLEETSGINSINFYNGNYSLVVNQISNTEESYGANDLNFKNGNYFSVIKSGGNYMDQSNINISFESGDYYEE